MSLERTLRAACSAGSHVDQSPTLGLPDRSTPTTPASANLTASPTCACMADILRTVVLMHVQRSCVPLLAQLVLVGGCLVAAAAPECVLTWRVCPAAHIANCAVPAQG